MKISVDGNPLFELSEIQKKVIANETSSDILEEDMKRRLEWVLMHKYEMCFENLKNQWDPQLASLGVKSVPTNKDEYAQLVMSLPTYKSRKDRDEQAI